MSSAIFFVAVIGIVFLAASVVLRSRSNNRYELKPIDLVVLLLPVIVWLLASGKIQKFAFSGLEVEVAQAFVDASRATVEKQVTPVEEAGLSDVVELVSRESKGGVDKIPRLIERKTEALSFQLGHGGYWGPAIREYFESLLAHGYLHYLVVNNKDGTLFGMYSAPNLLGYFRESGESAYQRFASDLNDASEAAKLRLAGLPAFVPVDHAVNSEMSKRDALERMEGWNEDVLPVVDESGRFVGTVSRSKLTASLILEVADRLGGE